MPNFTRLKEVDRMVGLNPRPQQQQLLNISLDSGCSIFCRRFHTLPISSQITAPPTKVQRPKGTPDQSNTTIINNNNNNT